MDRLTAWNDIIGAISDFRPDYENEIVSADESEISLLEKSAAQPMLPEYREFLRRMGHGLGGLSIATSDFDIQTVLKTYREPHRQIPSDLYFIGAQKNDETAYDVCLSLKEDQIGRVMRVLFYPVKRPDGTIVNAVSNQEGIKPYGEELSLQALVFNAAYHQFRLRGAHIFVRNLDSETDRDTALVDELFKGFGFRKHLLSDAWNHNYESDRGVAAFRRPSGKGNQILLTTSDSSLLEEFTILVKKKLDMRGV